MEEKIMSKLVCRVESRMEGKKDFNFLPTDAAGEKTWVNLVVAWFNVSSVFCNEAKGNFRPAGIKPLSTDDKGYEGETVGVEWFDEVKQVRAFFSFEVMNSCVR